MKIFALKTPLAHLVVALLLLVGVLALYGWWYSIVSGESAEVASLADQITAKTETARRIASARAASTELSADEAVVHAYFVSPADVVPFLEALQSVGARLGAKVSVLSVGESARGGSVSGGKPQDKKRPTLQIALQIKGTFDAVMRTIGALEVAPYAIRVESVSLSHGEAGWVGTLTFFVGTTGKQSL